MKGQSSAYEEGSCLRCWAGTLALDWIPGSAIDSLEHLTSAGCLGSPICEVGAMGSLFSQALRLSLGILST